MKYFKITLRQTVGNGDYIYPANYQQEIGNYNEGHLYFSENGEPRLLLCIKDVNAKNIIRDYVTEITEADAKAISKANETRKEIITDEVKIRRIELLAKLGYPLTENDKEAIDPNSPTSGFGIGKILADKIEDLKKEENIG